MLPDLVNGTFESLGGFFILTSVLRLYKDKRVLGVSILHVIFFALWGAWNLYYYPRLGQWVSFYGGLFVFITNTIWTAQIFYYMKYPGGRLGDSTSKPARPPSDAR